MNSRRSLYIYIYILLTSLHHVKRTNHCLTEVQHIIKEPARPKTGAVKSHYETSDGENGDTKAHRKQDTIVSCFLSACDLRTGLHGHPFVHLSGCHSASRLRPTATTRQYAPGFPETIDSSNCISLLRSLRTPALRDAGRYKRLIAFPM